MARLPPPLAMALMFLGASVLAMTPKKDDGSPPPDCTPPLPLYLRYPHTYLYHLKPDEALTTLISRPFPKIDDGFFRQRWAPKVNLTPPVNETDGKRTIQWEERPVQRGSEATNNDTFGWRHHPEPVVELTEEQKQTYIALGVQHQLGVEELNSKHVELNIKLPVDAPSTIHQNNFTYTLPRSSDEGKVGTILGFATKEMKSSLLISKFKVIELQLIEEKKICAQLGNVPESITCDPNSKYRRLDGRCNNLFHSSFGASFIPFRRLLPPEYGDGVSSPRLATDGSDLPNVRRVSLAHKNFSQRMSSCFSVFQMCFGQFIDHDLTATPTVKGQNGSPITCCDERVLQDPSLRHPECFPITLPSDDPFYSVYGHTCMEFVRSIPAGRCHFGPREQINQLTAFLDGSALYGSTREQVDALREFKGGLLKMQVTKEGFELLPITKGEEDACNDRKENSQGRFCFHSGTPGITYNEFLSGVLGPLLVKELELSPLKGRSFFTGYDDTVDPGVASEFSTAAFRFGHSMIPPHFYQKDNSGKYSAQEINDIIFHPFHMYDNDGMNSVLHGALAQSIGAVDNAFTSQITGKLFQRKKQLGLDLVALNLQRGRDHGLGGYIKARQACGFPAVKSFDDLRDIFNAETLAMIRTLYRSVDDIELFVGGLSEKPLPGGLVGATLGCIIADQFSRAKIGDRFWYENEGQPGSFTADQLQVLHNVSAARLICDNFPEVQSLQRWPLQLIGAHNPSLPCDSACIPEFDLSPWK
ncbi:chorion peroxidase-like [Eriocheir sinensis]|uniref:chorion peroxidase-like n=1 Tax=Eriocheir sinensis TaxID=95602 RepID=UPI0021C702E6|nr:chorion peroxidase-like [Eriocheir sinensis]